VKDDSREQKLLRVITYTLEEYGRQPEMGLITETASTFKRMLKRLSSF
jgi:hypothetical protein